MHEEERTDAKFSGVSLPLSTRKIRRQLRLAPLRADTIVRSRMACVFAENARFHSYLWRDANTTDLHDENEKHRSGYAEGRREFSQ